MKKLITNKDESINEMKRLFEFHFKPHTREEAIEFKEEPQEVKFNEIGDLHKAQQPQKDETLPSFNEYMEEVINEAPPTELAPKKSEEPKAEKSAPAPSPEPVPMQEPKAELPPPAPAPAPAPTMQEPPKEDNDEIKTIMDRQIQKTDELMSKLADMEAKLSQVNNSVETKIDTLSKEVAKNAAPSYQDQLEMISVNSGPFNVKLDDFWDIEEKPEEKKEYIINPKDVDSYSEKNIASSFRGNNIQQ